MVYFDVPGMDLSEQISIVLWTYQSEFQLFDRLTERPVLERSC